MRLPKGFGFRHEPGDQWVLNHMIHNLLPNRDRVYITYTLDFIPDTSPAAKGIREVRTQWLDVEGGKAYPVFDVHRGSRAGRALHLPERRPERLRRRPAAQPGDDPARRRARADRRAPAPGRPLHRPHAHPQRPHGQPVPLAREVLGARRRGVVGRGDDRDAAELARGGQARRRAQRLRHLRLQARVVVRVDGDHAGGLRGRRARRRRPVLRQARAPRPAHARPPAREPQPRRQARRARGPAHDAGRGAHERRPAGDHRLPLRPGRPAARRRRLAPARGRAGAEPDLRQPRRGAHDLPHDHRLPGALQPHDGHRLSARRRAGRLRLRRARLRPPGLHRRRQPRHLVDADDPRPRHLHVLLPRAPVHARRFRVKG